MWAGNVRNTFIPSSSFFITGGRNDKEKSLILAKLAHVASYV